MGFLKSIFGDNDRKELFDLIEYKAEIVMKKEDRTRKEAQYLAICLVLDALTGRSNGQKKIMLVIDMLNKEFSHHYVDVMTYLAIKSGRTTLQPEVEAVFMKPHR